MDVCIDSGLNRAGYMVYIQDKFCAIQVLAGNVPCAV